MLKKVYSSSQPDVSWKCLACVVPRPKPVALAISLPFNS